MTDLREKIARKRCEMDGWKWDGLDEVHKRFYDGKTKSDYYREADQLLALIKEAGYKSREEVHKSEFIWQQQIEHARVGYVKLADLPENLVHKIEHYLWEQEHHPGNIPPAHPGDR